MFWLLLGMSIDGLTTLVIGIVLSVTIANPVMPHLAPSTLHHPVASLRLAAHWDHKG